MRRICPLPSNWAMIHSALLDHAKKSVCVPQEPPKPLILAGWNFTDDEEKLERWQQTVQWANVNGCVPIVSCLDEDGWYRR